MKNLLTGLLFTLIFIRTTAQTPDMYPPPDPEPVAVTPLNIVLYIILPVVLIIAFILYRRSVKKRRNNNK